MCFSSMRPCRCHLCKSAFISSELPAEASGAEARAVMQVPGKPGGQGCGACGRLLGAVATGYAARRRRRTDCQRLAGHRPIKG